MERQKGLTKYHFYVAITALCWSTGGLFIKSVEQSGFLIVGAEAFFALVFCLLFQRHRFQWTKFVLMTGFFQFLMQICFVFANLLTTVGNTIVLQYTSMIFVLIYQSLDKRRLPKPYQLLVIVLALTGMVTFFFDQLSWDGLLGNILAIASGAFLGAQFYLNTKEQADANSSLYIQYFLCALTTLVYLAVHPSIQVSVSDGLYLLAAGIVTNGISGIFFAKGIEGISGFTANIICMSEAVLAPIWAFLFLHERLSPAACIGAVLIGSALVYNSIREVKET